MEHSQPMDVDSEAVREFKESLATPRFDPAPIAKHLCSVFNVRDVRYIVPFGTATHTWELMRESHIKVEVGSVSKGGAKPGVYQTSVVNRTLEAAEQQVTTCLLQPESEYCKYLDDPKPKKPFKNPKTQKPMPHDLSRACVYGVAVRHQLSSVPIRVAVRLSASSRPL